MIYDGQVLVNELLDASRTACTVDLGVIAPIGAIETAGGGAAVSLSLDGETFEPVEGNHARGGTARFVRVKINGGTCVSVVVRAGEGYVASRSPYWSDSFKRYEGWTGADGIYSFNITNGRDFYNNAAGNRTLFYFSDTLVSKIDRDTLRRQKPVYMPNNTFAVLDGEDPQKPGALRFHYDSNEKGEPAGVIKPSRGCYDFEGKGEDFGKAYFWLQDGVVLGGKLYFMPSIITEDKTQPEGFQFRGLGVAIAEAEIVDGMPDFKNAVQHAAELWINNDEVSILYGASILPNLREAGFEDGDGYVYVYGHMTFKGSGRRSLCVARVRPERFADWTKWRFFDGDGFVEDILHSKPLLDHISCEMSVIPISSGRNRGKYLAVFQYDTKSSFVAYAIGDSVCGPFSPPRKVFYCNEGEIHETVYMYNAKVHLHLSHPDKILASYNVNSTSSMQTDLNGHLYLPRFIQLEDTTVTDWERLFADVHAGRVAWFRTLNQSVIPGGTVFVGDSIINEFPVEEMLGEHMPVYNRGIGGDTTKGVLARMDESVFELRPSKLFLLIGTNDIGLGACTGQQLASNVAVCIDRVKERLPGCQIFLISILPVNNSGHPKINPDAVSIRTNEVIAAVNARLAELAREKQATYVDLHSQLIDESGTLRIEYTREGLHLSPQGYEAFVRAIKQYL